MNLVRVPKEISNLQWILEFERNLEITSSNFHFMAEALRR